MSPLKAMSLLGRWVRVSQAHVAFGGGCSCGDDLAPLHVGEMAMRVMDTLAARHSDNAAIQTLLAERADYRRNESGSIGGLLKAIAMRSAKGVNDEDQFSMLAELERSIESLDAGLRMG